MGIKPLIYCVVTLALAIGIGIYSYDAIEYVLRPVLWGVNKWEIIQENDFLGCWIKCLNETQRSTVLYATACNQIIESVESNLWNVYDNYNLSHWKMAIEGHLYQTLDNAVDCCKDFSSFNTIFDMNYPQK